MHKKALIVGYTIYSMDETITTDDLPDTDGYEEPKEVNIYPAVRTIVLILIVVLCLGAILFLLYLNGKSVYESGV